MLETGTVSPLARYLAVSYALLIVYACLHPMTGWSVSGLPTFDYLIAPWPKYIRNEDLVVNVLGYVPLGFVLATALLNRGGRGRSIVVAAILAGLLSLAIETIQNYLPNRVSSNVDLGCNILGALIGATAGAFWGRSVFAHSGALHRWRSNRVVSGRTGDLGLILAGLWLLTQLRPESMLFSSGDLRSVLGLPSPVRFDPEHFIRLETIVVATGAVAIGLFARCVMRSSRLVPILLLLALGIGAKTLASWSFFVPGDPAAWLTPGTQAGLLIGIPLLGVALLLPSLHQHALAGVALLGASILANLIPENPYLLAERSVLEHGNFLNFHGLTTLVASGWSFLALAYLSALGIWRGDHLHDG